MPPTKRSYAYVGQGGRMYTSKPRLAGPYKPVGLSIKKALLKASEQKATAFAITTQHADTTGEVRLITAPANGADANMRVGKKCQVNMVELNLKIVASAVTAGATPGYQWWLVYDKHPNGALPALADIIVGTFPSIVLPPAEPRFTVLGNGYGFLAKPVNYETGSSAKVITKKIRCNKQMVFTGDTGAIASISEGAIYLVTSGDTANASPHPTMTGEAAIYFKDV
ncbi:MAG: coat protein/nuclear export [Cressdnaviricota sp.]|nr:MAG: coat protein/nuclear export [Cressdnaviricota sp.]